MRKGSDQHISGYLREVCAAAQGLQTLLSNANANAAGKTAADRTTAYAAALVEANMLRTQTTSRIIGESIAAIRKIFLADAAAHDWCADYIVRIENEMSMIGTTWPAVGKSADEVADAFRQAIIHLDVLVFQCSSLTVSSRINDVLDNMRVGQAVRFFDEFSQELPLKSEFQVKLFGELVSQCVAIENGYLDEETGLIYRVGATRAAQRWSVVRILGAVLLGLVVAALIGPLGANLRDWPLKDLSPAKAVQSYIFLCGGSAAHLAIAAVSTSRAKPNSRRVPWNDWILWLNAHEMAVLYGVGYLVLGFLFLTFSLKDLGWLTAFFAGYSIDSVVEVFLDRINRLAKDQSGTLMKTLAVAPPGGGE